LNFDESKVSLDQHSVSNPISMMDDYNQMSPA